MQQDLVAEGQSANCVEEAEVETLAKLFKARRW